MKPLPNEIRVVTVQRNGYTAYQITRGENELIMELASKPSDDDVRNALRLYADQSTTQESARVTQLRGKHQIGAWTGNDDDFPPRAA